MMPWPRVYVSEPVVRRLRRITDQRLIRREPEPEVRAGLTQLVTYTVEVSLARLCDVRVGDENVHPSSLRTRSGERLAVRTRWRGDGIDVVGMIHESEQPQTFRGLNQLPWEQRERFDPRRLIAATGSRHLLDHPERYGGPVSHAVVCTAISKMKDLVLSGEVQVSRYWYEPARSWCFVAPLVVPNCNPLAAVLVAGRDTYDIVTVLPLHETFWNVATVGLAPPAWLNRPAADLPLAA